MPREKDGYRDILELLNERYPDHDMLRIKECGAVLGVSKYETVMNRLGRAGVPIVDAKVNKVFLARYMCGSLHR